MNTAKSADPEPDGIATPAQLVSIVILNWNKAELTLDCIRLVREHTREINYEIVVIDNGSTADEFHLLTRQLPPEVRLISLRENLYFGEANNIGVEAATGDYVLFLNNDVQVTAGYLAPLLRAFAENYSVGGVGSKFLYPDGSLQEAGAFVLEDGNTFQQGKFGMEVSERFNQGCQIVDYCSAACLLVRRDAFLAICGFDPLYDPAYFEDVDLSFRLRSNGLYTYYCSESVVYHLENMTSLAVWSRQEVGAVAAANHERFYQRWKGYLAERLVRDIEPPPLREVKPVARAIDAALLPKLLLCTSGRMEISDECRDMLVLAETLGSHYDIEFATREMCSMSRIRSLCRHYGIGLHGDRVHRFAPENLNGYQRVVLFGDLGVDSAVGTALHRASDAGLVEQLLGH